MRRRVLTAILSVAAVALMLFGIPLAILVTRFVDTDSTLKLERQAVLATRDVPADFASGQDPAELPATTDDIVLALYDISGKIVAGSGPSTADLAVTRALSNQVSSTEVSERRVVAVPLTAAESVVGAVRAEQPTGHADARARRIITLLGALALGVLAVGASIGFIVAGRLARPVRRLRDVAVRVGDGDFTVDVTHCGIGELDEATDAMAITAQRLDDLVQRERAFSADASHQLRTPLAGLRTAIETELEFPRDDHAQILRDSLDDVGRLERTITELLTIARTPNRSPGSCNLAVVLREIDGDWHGRFAGVGRPLIVGDASDAPPVNGSVAVLRHAVDVLLDNAFIHGAGPTRIECRISSATVTLSISDEGAGFDTSTETVGLHGHGLPLARRLIEALPGRLTIVRTAPHPRFDVVLVPTASGRRELHRRN